MNILFMGSGTFSVPTLKKILNNKDFNLVAIYTGEPKKQNRGHKICNNIVHDKALEYGFCNNLIFYPNKLNNEAEINRIKSFKPDVIIVVAYGKIIPDSIISIPKEIINIHPSSLPKYRGAAPIERTIENGEKEIDICIIKVIKELDAGDILTKQTLQISKDDHANDVITKCSEIGSELLIKSLYSIKNNQYSFTKQNNLENIIYAKKIEKEELLLDFNNDVKYVYNKIRAFNMHGGCYFIDKKNKDKIKILNAKYLLNESIAEQDIGNFDRNNGYISCNNGYIIPIILQKEGRQKIDLKSFLNGFK